MIHHKFGPLLICLAKSFLGAIFQRAYKRARLVPTSTDLVLTSGFPVIWFAFKPELKYKNLKIGLGEQIRNLENETVFGVGQCGTPLWLGSFLAGLAFASYRLVGGWTTES